ncbi:MAG: PH domain-containing protein [Patescibacteria group bacterium]
MTHLINEEVNANEEAFLYLNLHPDEKILYVVRHHWAGFVGTLGIVFFMVIFPILLVFVGNLVLKDLLTNYAQFLVVGISGYYLFLLTFLFGAWIDYYYDIIFITGQRLLNVNQKGLLSREVSELDLRQVQNVSAQTNGLLQTYFNYGILIVETAGEGTSDSKIKGGIQGFFSVADLPDPNRLARVILELRRKIIAEEEH